MQFQFHKQVTYNQRNVYAHYMTRSYSSLRLSNFPQISEMNWSLFMILRMQSMYSG